jgi:selenocysteine-specific elongation factor
VSARDGAGLEQLRAALGRAADGIEQVRSDRPTRLPVDRSFTLRGIGTVVTGTLWSGSVGPGDELRLEPEGVPVRVRSVQVHDRDVERAEAGQRVAVSLPGIERQQVARGDVLAEPGAYPVSYRLDVALDELEPIEDGALVLVYHGTTSSAGRVVRLGAAHAQLRLRRPVVSARGDRVVLRAETTLGGGVVVDPAPPRHRDPERVARIERGEVVATVSAPVRLDSLRHVLESEPEGLERAGEWVFSRAWLDALGLELRTRIEASDPIDPGVTLPPAPWAADVVPLLPFERRGSKLYLPGATATLAGREADVERLDAELAAAGTRATKVSDEELVRFGEATGALVRLGDGYVIGADAYRLAREVALSEAGSTGELTLARFRDLVGTGRRDAQLLLERFDRDGLTRRVGDRRVLRSGAPRTGGGRSPAGRAS